MICSLKYPASVAAAARQYVSGLAKLDDRLVIILDIDTLFDPNELDLYQRVHIKPFAELRQVGFVQVLRHPTRRPLT